MPNALETTNLVIGGTAASGFVVWAIKFLMKSVRQEKLDSIVSSAEGSAYLRLQEEISKLTKRVSELEKHIEALRANELGDSADIASLSLLLGMMPCGKCEIGPGLYESAAAAVARMEARRSLEVD